MSGMITFQTPHGPVSVEVTEAEARGVSGQAMAPGFTAKGVAPRSPADLVEAAGGSFDAAMSGFRAYAASLGDMVAALPIKPKEVSFELGLKMSGSAGFIIASASGEATIKVALKWQTG